MRKLVPFVIPIALVALEVRDASACGGCFVPPEESTQVTGHRMILSLSMDQTTLYDQIEYAGNPAEFAWVLPILGQVDVGLSSDGLFAFLGQQTKPYVAPPPVVCPPPPEGCEFYYPTDDFAAGGGNAGGAGGGSNGGVTVIAQEVVGPYETVQLQASDPAALQTWLLSHGYNLPDDIAPVVNAYVDEGFGFLAMKLVPGQDVTAMRPVRVTSAGAGLALPLRMVAAGTGAYTPITLFVVAEGRYEPQNFPNFEISEDDLTFKASTWESNWDALREAGFEANGENAWLTESSRAGYRSDLEAPLQNVVYSGSGLSGYDPTDWMKEQEEFEEDMAALFGGINANSVWYTRLYANLPRQSLGQDLAMAAKPGQAQRLPSYQATTWDGAPPPCPDYSWCDSDWVVNKDGPQVGGATFHCAFGAGAQASGLGMMAVAAMVAGLRRRRRG